MPSRFGAAAMSGLTAWASRIRTRLGNRRRGFAGVVALAAITLLVAACNPGLVSSVAGNGTAGNSGDGGKATDASFEQPGGLAVLPDGSYDVVDENACVIRHVSTDGSISTIAGTGTCGYSGDGGPATAAQINPLYRGDAPSGQLAVDAQGNLYLSDSNNSRIRRIAIDGTITTVAGGTPSSLLVGCTSTAVLPGSLSFTPDGTLYVSCPNGVYKVLSDGSLQIVIADIAVSMTTDKAGDIYYADNDGVVHKRTPTGTMTTVADLPALGFAPPNSSMVGVTGLSVGPDGSLYAALGPTDLLESLYPEPIIGGTDINEVLRLGSGTATVIAGSGDKDPGTGTQSGYGTQLALTPYGIAATADNGLLVSSGHNVYSLDSANLAQPWSGTLCDPSKVKPGYDLSNQDLAGSDFYRCNLTGVNLSNTNLSGANLKQAILDDANLSGTNLSGATLDGAHGVGIIGIPSALPTGWSVRTSVLVPPTGDLQGLNLSGRNLHGIDLHGTDLTGANLRNTDLSGADLAGANLSNTQLQNTNFTGANLSGANLTTPSTQGTISANFTNANLSNLIITPFNASGGSLGATLYGSTFTGANLAGADLRSLKLIAVTSGGVRGTPQLPAAIQLINGYFVTVGANLTGANLHGIDLSNVDLSEVNFTNTNLSHVNLTKANLTHADFTDANLTNANLTGATLTSATVANTDFAGATATSVIANTLTGIPANAPAGVQFRTDPTATHGAFLYPGANLNGSNLIGVDLSGIDLTGAGLDFADLLSADLANTNLTNAILVNAILDDANLSGANLTGANLRLATVVNANFAGATATSAVANGLFGTPASAPLGEQFRTNADANRGAFLYPGVNLTNAGLDGVDLSGIDLTGANLSGALVRSTNLAGTNLTNANLSFANFGPIPFQTQLTTGTPIGADTSTYNKTGCPDSTVVSSPATCIGHGF